MKVFQRVSWRLFRSQYTAFPQGSRALSSGSTSTFLTGENSVYAEEMYQQWKKDPSSVHASWNVYFSNMEKGLFSFVHPNDLDPSKGISFSSGGGNESVNLIHLIRAYQALGHMKAKIDPLNLMKTEIVPELDPATYGFTEADMEKEYDLSGFSGIAGFLKNDRTITLKRLVSHLQNAYSRSIGVEYMHIASREKCNFLRERFEKPTLMEDRFSTAEKLQILDRLAFACKLEKFLGNKWNTAKRFGLEGCESFIPGFKALIDRSTELGVENVFIGMAHRGRLNVLANVIRKPLSVLFSEFDGTAHDAVEMKESLERGYALAGDVKYHLGATFDRKYPDGRKVHLALIANPSHLEAVNPIVEGRARARQYYDKDESGQKTLPVLIHGDAAFCGQGVVYETMHLGALDYYKTGGTAHIIVNNQIGFTTDPHHSRSTRYSTDLGKAFDCPIFHVNAEDPIGVAYACQMAAEYRQQFKSDVIVDITGYRQMGHNEMDQPFFTQPEMYSVIKKKPNVLDIFSDKLIKEGVVTESRLQEIDTKILALYEENFQLAKEGKAPKEKWLESLKWEKLIAFGETAKPKPTHVEEGVLKELGKKANTPPEGFTPHPTLKKMLQQRLERLESGKNIDWGLAEQLAFASLLNENFHVRISGQDSQRGTFAHRHAVLHDQKNFEMWTGLNSLFTEDEINEGRKQRFIASNSSLSEYGVMGFELGYSLEDPNALIIWEGQFGDFVNGAQIIIDQFLSNQEQKWNRQCGLVLLLPHGYDGQGPDHSSARIERFLQQTDEDPDVVPPNVEAADRTRAVQDCNWQIVNCTTPANIFHALRRQVHRDFRKPLIVASPKAILRTCHSDLSELTDPNARFQPLINEVDKEIEASAEKVRKLIFCSGKIYYELEAEREKQGKKDVAIVRIEQIAPFPFYRVAEEVQRYKNAECLFVQEEPKNMGTWHYADDRIYTAIKHYTGEERRCRYIGRGTMSSPAVGYANVHMIEQRKIIERALE